jgi:Glycogen recognition site of AMP-activated protein kinase
MVQKSYLKTKNAVKVKFSVKPELASNVAVLGLNGDWDNAIVLTKKKDGSFVGEVSLEKESRHEFKYLIDGELWLNEAEADSEVENAFGGTNSVLIV